MLQCRPAVTKIKISTGLRNQISENLIISINDSERRWLCIKLGLPQNLASMYVPKRNWVGGNFLNSLKYRDIILMPMAPNICKQT